MAAKFSGHLLVAALLVLAFRPPPSECFLSSVFDDINSFFSRLSPSKPAQQQPIAKQVSDLYKGKSTADTQEESAPVSSGSGHRSYCHPPNPCPIGHTPQKNGCDAGIVDSADWNRINQEMKMRKGDCACDVEHMFTCPRDVAVVSVASAKAVDAVQEPKVFHPAPRFYGEESYDDSDSETDDENADLNEVEEEAEASKKSYYARSKRAAEVDQDDDQDDQMVIAKKSPPFF